MRTFLPRNSPQLGLKILLIPQNSVKLLELGLNRRDKLLKRTVTFDHAFDYFVLPFTESKVVNYM